MSPYRASLDSGKAAGIQRIRRIATGILIFLSLVFLSTFAVADPPTWLLLIRAMAEAGMVGGLADWFAVEALFRHPLKLPIPHTALLPNNQKRAAKDIARFIDEYFLVPEQLLQKLEELNPVRRLAEWLSYKDNAQNVARELSQLLKLILKSQLRHGISPKTTELVRDLLLNSVQSKDLARPISALLKDTTRGEVLNEILREVHSVIDLNREKVTELVQEKSRWWIASAVDKQIVKVLVDGILSIVDELSDENSKLRGEFNSSLTGFVDAFQNSGRIAHFIDQGRIEYANSASFEQNMQMVIEAILSRIEKRFDDHPEDAEIMLSDALIAFAQMVLEQPALEAQISERLKAGLTSLLTEIRPAIVSYITQVITEWDSDELVDRIEFEVGRDLQFIRINGAVLGAFVGGCLFLITKLLH